MKKVCPICKKEFVTDTPQRRYCSKECAHQAKKEQIKAWHTVYSKRKKELDARWYAAHREEVLTKTRAWRNENRELVNTNERVRYQRKREAIDKLLDALFGDES